MSACLGYLSLEKVWWILLHGLCTFHELHQLPLNACNYLRLTANPPFLRWSKISGGARRMSQRCCVSGSVFCQMQQIKVPSFLNFPPSGASCHCELRNRGRCKVSSVAAMLFQYSVNALVTSESP